MKKIKVYEINEGLDGVVVAKSMKHAVKKLAPYYGYKVHEIIKDIKKSDEDYKYDADFELTRIDRVAKKGEHRKSRVLGWCE